jgi:vacuolar-type H+-ATPase catalytic subunit A/Vma1
VTEKLPANHPLLTGQRVLDGLFPSVQVRGHFATYRYSWVCRKSTLIIQEDYNVKKADVAKTIGGDMRMGFAKTKKISFLIYGQRGNGKRFSVKKHENIVSSSPTPFPSIGPT